MLYVVRISHIAVCTQVVVFTLGTMPPHAFDASSTTSIASFIGMLDTCKYAIGKIMKCKQSRSALIRTDVLL